MSIPPGLEAFLQQTRTQRGLPSSACLQAFPSGGHRRADGCSSFILSVRSLRRIDLFPPVPRRIAGRT
jgi:hypothetical protein